MLKVALLATAALIVAHATASAADLLPTRKAPPPIFSGVSWEGIYVGVNWGVASGNSKWSDGAGLFGLPVVANTLPANSPNEGLFVGGTVGINHQIGPWVFGLEGDLQAADLDGHGSAGAGAGFVPGLILHTHTDLLGSLTPRIGYAAGHALYYVKGGGAYAHDTTSYSTGLFTDNGSASANRFGWTLGVGAEYAITANLSAKVEYDYYGLGSKTISMPDVAAGNAPTSVSVMRDQQLVKFGLNYRFGWENPDAVTAPEILPDLKGEIGTRVGWSSGQFRKNLYDPIATSQLNSRLTYSSLDAMSIETFSRWDHTSGVFLKTTFGGADIFGGHLHDEDFPPGIAPYSNTLSSQKDGRDLYGWGDLGYSFWRGGNWKVGGFAGYEYFSQRENAVGCVQVAGNPAVCAAGAVPSNQLGITETEHWQGVRVGLNGDIMLTDRIKLYGEAAYLPWVAFSGTDNHWLRPDINPLSETGRGDGVQLEAIASYLLTQNLSVGVGARFMDLVTSSAHTQFPAAPAASPEKFSTERAGVFLQASYLFGGP
jgi:opacity protein-like surface antigen